MRDDYSSKVLFDSPEKAEGLTVGGEDSCPASAVGVVGGVEDESRRVPAVHSEVGGTRRVGASQTVMVL